LIAIASGFGLLCLLCESFAVDKMQYPSLLSPGATAGVVFHVSVNSLSHSISPPTHLQENVPLKQILSVGRLHENDGKNHTEFVVRATWALNRKSSVLSLAI
jgi:hypothetical protein